MIWTLAGEYNMNNYGGFGLPFWKDLGVMVKSEDPYRRIVSAHPTPPGWSGGADAPQWSTGEVLHSEPWNPTLNWCRNIRLPFAERFPATSTSFMCDTAAG